MKALNDFLAANNLRGDLIIELKLLERRSGASQEEIDAAYQTFLSRYNEDTSIVKYLGKTVHDEDYIKWIKAEQSFISQLPTTEPNSALLADFFGNMDLLSNYYQVVQVVVFDQNVTLNDVIEFINKQPARDLIINTVITAGDFPEHTAHWEELNDAWNRFVLSVRGDV